MTYEEKINSFEDFKQTLLKQEIHEQSDLPISDSKNYHEYFVEFITQSYYTVGMVDMVNSSKISAKIGPEKSAKYYQIFLNSMSKIISKHKGIVIKNIGDCLFYYFPYSDKTNIASCLDCSLEMILSKKSMSQQLSSQGLPDIDFRISADYGIVLLMNTGRNYSIDMFGTPVNMCSKINRLAAKNQFLIGSDLFQIVRELKDYRFKEITDFSLGFKQSYPVYSVQHK